MAIIRKERNIDFDKLRLISNKHPKLIEIAKRLMESYKEKQYLYFQRPWDRFKNKPHYEEIYENNKYRNQIEKRSSKIGKIWFITTEPKTWHSAYIPDVIGWYLEQSVVFECKVTRNDFLNDKKKKNKLGHFFYYIAPAGIINPNELRTEGLFEVPLDYMEREIKLKDIKLIKPCIRLEKYYNYFGEMNCLIYILRKHHIH